MHSGKRATCWNESARAHAQLKKLTESVQQGGRSKTIADASFTLKVAGNNRFGIFVGRAERLCASKSFGLSK